MVLRQPASTGSYRGDAGTFFFLCGPLAKIDQELREKEGGKVELELTSVLPCFPSFPGLGLPYSFSNHLHRSHWNWNVDFGGEPESSVRDAEDVEGAGEERRVVGRDEGRRDREGDGCRRSWRVACGESYRWEGTSS